jgi:hypothetical protein
MAILCCVAKTSLRGTVFVKLSQVPVEYLQCQQKKTAAKGRDHEIELKYVDKNR